MSAKITINEQCEYCGGRAAWFEGDTVLVSHNCDQMPPGPSDPPRRYPVDRVDYRRGDFCEDEYRDELDAAFTLIKILKEQRLDLSDRLRHVRDAVKNWKDWRED